MQKAINDRAFYLGVSKYSSGKIYGIRHKVTKQLAYTGSTVKSLRSRWCGHVSFFKTNPNSKWTKFVNDNGGPVMFAIELIESYPCKDNASLLDRERFYINNLNPTCNVMMTGEKTNLSPPTRKHPKNTQPPRSRFDDVDDLTKEEFMMITEMKRKKEHHRQQTFAFEKYIVSNACSDRVSLDNTKFLFDDMQMTPAHKYWLFNGFRWMMTSADGIDMDFGIDFGALDMTGAVPNAVQAHMEKICKILGMRNMHDTDRSLTREDIEDSLSELSPHLTSLRTLLKSRICNKKDDF